MSYSKSLSQEAPCHFDAMPENSKSWKVRDASPPSLLSQLSWWVKPAWFQQICGIKWKSHSAGKETAPVPIKLISALYLLAHNRTCKICSVNKDVLLWLNALLRWSANPKGNERQILPWLYRCAAWLRKSSHTCRWGNTLPNIETSLSCSLWTQKQTVQTGIFNRA